MPSVEQIRRVITRYESQGADKAVNDLNRVAAAEKQVAAGQERVSQTTDELSRRETSLANRVHQINMRYNEQYRAAFNLRKGIDDLNAAKEQGLFNEDRLGAAAYTSSLENLHAKLGQSKGDNDNWHISAQKNFRLTGYEVTNLTYQLNDMATMLAAGSSPFQVLATQGGQVYQILAGTRGGLGAGLKSLGGLIAGLVTPSRLAAGGFLALGVAATAAFASWLDGQQKLDNSLQGLGRSTQATVGQLEGIADAGAAAAKMSVASARDITASLASTGKIGTESYVGLIAAAKSFARVTGTEIEEAGQTLANAFADPAKGAADLDQKLNFLDQSTLDYIRTLSNHNQRSQAQQVLLKALNDNLPEATSRLTLLGRAWQDVSSFASNAYNAMGRAVGSLIYNPALDQQIADLEKRLRDQQAVANGPGGRAAGTAAAAAAQTQAELDRLRAQRDADNQRAQRAQTQQQEKDAIAAARAADPRYAELDSITKQITATQGVIAKNKQANSDFDAMWGGSSQTVQELETHLSGLKNRYDELANSQGMLKPITEGMRKELDLQVAVVTAATQAERNRAQASLDEYRARAAGSTDAVVAATKENSLLQSNAEMNAQAAQAQRERIRGAEEAAAAQQLEINLIGKTAGETAVLRANYQAFVDLQREAAQTGLPFDAAKYEAIKKQNEALREQVDLYARANLRDQVQFDIDQVGRSQIDATIASTLRSAGLPVDLSSADAALIRTREVITSLKDASRDALGGVVQDLQSGASAAEAAANAVSRLGSRLLDVALDQITAGFFGNKNQSGSGMNIFGSILGMFGLGGGSSLGMGGIGHAARGGAIVGPGSGTSDTAGLYALSNGEYVVNAQATARNRRALDAMNYGRMASGGYVGNDNGPAPRSSVLPTVNIIGAPNPQNTEVKMSSDGTSLDIILDKKMASNVAKSGSRTQRSMRQTYGIGQKVVRR